MTSKDKYMDIISDSKNYTLYQVRKELFKHFLVELYRQLKGYVSALSVKLFLVSFSQKIIDFKEFNTFDISMLIFSCKNIGI